MGLFNLRPAIRPSAALVWDRRFSPRSREARNLAISRGDFPVLCLPRWARLNRLFPSALLRSSYRHCSRLSIDSSISHLSQGVSASQMHAGRSNQRRRNQQQHEHSSPPHRHLDTTRRPRGCPAGACEPTRGECCRRCMTPSLPPLPHRVPHPQQGHNGEAHAEPNRDDDQCGHEARV